ncbi:MAG: PorV/PorQ family protein [bacterium]|nr:PorV/PorQ family protein [bacterium]
MQKNLVGFLLSGLLLCLIGSEAAFATAVPSLRFGVGGRASGMGEAFVGLADDAEAIFYNPAGLSQFKKREAMVVYAPLSVKGGQDDGMSQFHLAYAHPLNKWGTLGIGIFRMQIGKIETNEGYNPIDEKYEIPGVVDIYEDAYILSYSYPLTEKLFAGTNGKYIYSHLSNEFTGKAWTYDLGLLWHTPLSGLAMGVNWENDGEISYQDDPQKDPLPGNLRYGFSYKAWEDKNNKVTVTGDINKYQVEDLVPINLGVEWDIANSLFARVGYFNKERKFDGLKWEKTRDKDGNVLAWGLKGYTWGFGLKYGSWNFDFSSVPGGVYDRLTRASLSASF